MGERIRVAAYCRVSTEGEGQAGSFAAQKRYFAERIGWETGWQLGEIYADEGKSGTDTCHREAFNRMMKEAAEGKFTLLLTKEVSRFSRNILDTIACVRQLKRLGVAVLFLNDGIDTRQPDAELRLSIMGSLAQEESRRTSERVKWGQVRQMEQGVVFGRSLLGYTVQRGRLEIEPQGAAIVQHIFELYTEQKLGTERISRVLQAKGIPTMGGGPWRAGTIGKILQNEKYVGDLIQKKSRTPDYLTHKREKNHGEEPLIALQDHHAGIISRELWEKAQQERARRRRTAGAAGCANGYPLSGKIRCGVCGGVFRPKRRSDAAGHVTLKWGCRAGCGIGRMLRQPIAEDLIRQTIAGALWNREREKKKYETLLEAVREGETQAEKMAAAQRERVRESRWRLWENYLAGGMTREDMEALKQRYDERERALMEQTHKKDREPLLQRWQDLWQGATSEALCRELVEEIIVWREQVKVNLRGGMEQNFIWVEE